MSHDTPRMRSVYVYIRICQFILKAYAGAGCCTLIVFGIAKIRKQRDDLFKSEVFGEAFEALDYFLFSSHDIRSTQKY